MQLGFRQPCEHQALIQHADSLLMVCRYGKWCLIYVIGIQPMNLSSNNCLIFLQLSPLKRPIKTERVVTFSSPSAQTFFFPVEGGRTVELAVAQFWSSGLGSHETTMVDFEVNLFFPFFLRSCISCPLCLPSLFLTIIWV